MQTPPHPKTHPNEPSRPPKKTPPTSPTEPDPAPPANPTETPSAPKHKTETSSPPSPSRAPSATPSDPPSATDPPDNAIPNPSWSGESSDPTDVTWTADIGAIAARDPTWKIDSSSSGSGRRIDKGKESRNTNHPIPLRGWESSTDTEDRRRVSFVPIGCPVTSGRTNISRTIFPWR
mmetsp:Transcript_15844/g.32438  ORF Transcript_15844/g.32438 Transcript_15844/m.32438 type:complete len:177 (+) Transcript_15844:328-858(+)